MGIFVFFGLIYIAIRIVKEEWGMGDFYRSVGMTKRGKETDSAVGSSVVFLGFIAIIFLMTLFQ